MRRETLDDSGYIQLKPVDIFMSDGAYVLTDFGSCLQGLIINSTALKDKDMGDMRRMELLIEIEGRYLRLEESQGIEIPRDQIALGDLGKQFAKLVREREYLLSDQLYLTKG